MIQESPGVNSGLARKPDSLRTWRKSVIEGGFLPVIVVAGSRGKSTVSNLVQHMIGDQYRIGRRSQDGVDILGIRQQGEIEPWNRVETMLRSGDLDVAIWELDWATASTLPESARHAVVALTNVCANREACFIYGDAKIAMRSLPGIVNTLEDGGVLILNGEDQAVADLGDGREHTSIMAGLGVDSPAIGAHWQAGGVCAWVESDHLCIGHRQAPLRLLRTDELSFALNGVAGFEVHNALVASAIAYAIGLRSSAIAAALRSFRSDYWRMPGSFNIMYASGVPIIIDRPAPSWFLRPVVRALRDFRQARLLTVVGRFDDVPEEDLGEVGRLLGRVSSAVLIATGRSTDGYPWELLRDGAMRNEVPPVVLPFATEHAAFRKAQAMARAADTIYLLSESPEQLHHFWPTRGKADSGASAGSSAAL
ncbi:hypothetical protein BH23CHL5_BH23CHL5_03160 [soil metagenome]